METIALFGAGGAIGRSVANELRARGRSYRVVGRNRARLEAQYGKSAAEIVIWDPDDPASTAAAARGIDTLVYLVGVPYNQFQLHPILTKKTLHGAITAGVKRFVLVSTVYPYGVPITPTVSEQHPREPRSFKGRMRKAQEDLLLDTHAEGKIDATILRLPDFYGPGVEASLLRSLFRAAGNGGSADLIGPIDRPHEFVFVPDVGPVLLDLAAHPDAYGAAWNLAGAGAITQKEIAETVFRMAGRSSRLRVSGKGMLRMLGLFNPMLHELVEMHYLLTTPVLLDDTALHGLLGKIKKTSYAEGLRITLDAYRSAEAGTAPLHSPVP